MNAAQVKFLVSLAIILALWRVFEIPGVATAFWAFITIGAIPGTDKIMGSDMMLRILCILFAVCFFLIFRKEFMASLPRRRPPRASKALMASETSVAPRKPGSEQNPLQRTIVTLRRQKDRPSLQIVRPLFVTLCFVLASAMTVGDRAEQLAERFMRAAGRHVRHATNIVHRALRSAAAKIYRFLYLTGRVIVRSAIMIWRASEPRIRAFDHWLEVQLHANARTAAILKHLDSAGRTAAAACRRMQDAKRRLLE